MEDLNRQLKEAHDQADRYREYWLSLMDRVPEIQAIAYGLGVLSGGFVGLLIASMIHG